MRLPCISEFDKGMSITHIHHTDEDILLLSIDGETIETTAEHPFYTEEGAWINAAELEAGDYIQSFDGDQRMVESVLVVEADQRMYNLTVDEVHMAESSLCFCGMGLHSVFHPPTIF